MKTTFDLPPDLMQRSKIVAARRRVSLKSLVIQGLESVLGEEPDLSDRSAAALERLNRGYRLGNEPLSRE